MEFGTVAKQRDIAKRRSAIALLACGDVGDRCQRIAIHVGRFQPHRSITATRHSFSRIQAKQVSTGNLVQNAPHFLIRIRPYVGWRGLPPRSAFKIEAQPIPGDATYTTFERPDAAALNKCSHVHVGAVREVPDFVRWPPVQQQTMPPIVPTRQVPRFRQQSTPSNSHADGLHSSCHPKSATATAFRRTSRGRKQACRRRRLDNSRKPGSPLHTMSRLSYDLLGSGRGHCQHGWTLLRTTFGGEQAVL
jgi:hypothetical protein